MQTLPDIYRSNRLSSSEILARAADRAQEAGDLVAAFKLREEAQKVATEAMRRVA